MTMSCQVRQWLRDDVLKDTSVAQRQLLFLLGRAGDGVLRRHALARLADCSVSLLLVLRAHRLARGNGPGLLLEAHGGMCRGFRRAGRYSTLYASAKPRTVDFAAIFDPRSTTHSVRILCIDFSDDIQDNTLAWELCAVLRAQPAGVHPAFVLCLSHNSVH